MINNNKILTVSYGTFSCTLEGFDDSFGTMKAIAEYFRDLAADDRYFGAEPPQPDAQMLARIAQREISRHVEARQDEGRIVLSAKSTPQAAALVADAVMEDVAEAVAEAAVAKAAPDAPTAEPAPVAQAPKQTPREQVIADEAAEEETVEIEAPAVEEAAQQETSVQDVPDIVPTLPDAQVEAFFADSQTDTAVDDDFETDTAGQDTDVAPHEADIEPAEDRARADSIADKLKRIRAVVSQQSITDAAPDYSEDEHAEAPPATITDDIAETLGADGDTSDVLANTLRDLEDAMDADDEMETYAADSDEDLYDDADEESEDDDITAILNRLDREAGDSTPAAAAELDEDDDEMDGNILAAMDTVEALDDAGDDNLFEGDDAPEEEPEAAAPAPQPAAPRTRVLKVKRATLEAAIKAGKLEEYEEDDADETPQAATKPPLRKAPLAEVSSLSDEAEEELARELAELEADMAASEASDAAPVLAAAEETAEQDDFDEIDEEDDLEDFDAEEAEVDAPAPRANIRSNADADLARLMEEAKHQMDEPESATRRDAFAHLRAAVAAKKADEAVAGTLNETDSGEAYRDDLANVVRPRRPTSSERTRTERPAEPRPAPLKLVAEQRIDVSEPRKIVPVRPRRVAAVERAQHAPSAAAAEAGSFADFASEMGADSLPDLLEAAAAYLSFVEGHEQFSRPQLMTKVRQVEQENFTREDSLRSFGKLLREGKIEKLSGGRFQASEQIGFKPDARAAG